MSKDACQHQYVERYTGCVRDETLYWDRAIRFLYSPVRERAPWLFAALTSRRMSSVLRFLNYDHFVSSHLVGSRRLLRACGIDVSECLADPSSLDTLSRIFERQIRYWECRPMPEEKSVLLSPADARMVCGSLSSTSLLCVKGKFFDLDELLGDRCEHKRCFANADWAVFRLTPEKYHYSHVPATGIVTDFYEVDGANHSCNPSAVVEVVTPYSKNRRTVTILDTDVPGGAQVGKVAMIEVAALMIGGIVQCFSESRYDHPRAVERGMLLERGAPKSRYRPGGSTDILLFESGRVRFHDDLLRAQLRTDVISRFSAGFSFPLVETEVQVRSAIAEAVR